MQPAKPLPPIYAVCQSAAMVATVLRARRCLERCRLKERGVWISEVVMLGNSLKLPLAALSNKDRSAQVNVTCTAPLAVRMKPPSTHASKHASKHETKAQMFRRPANFTVGDGGENLALLLRDEVPTCRLQSVIGQAGRRLAASASDKRQPALTDER